MEGLIPLAQLAPLLAASMLLTLAPGPDNLMVLSLGMARGRREAIAFGLGCAAGCLNHTVLAAIGVGALLAASKPAFTALKIAGGLYLVWLGIQAIRTARAGIAAPAADGPRAPGAGRLFVRGLCANAINPKVILFFLAFLPQFVDASRHDGAWQMVQIGIIFAAQAALIFAAIGWFAGGIGERLMRRSAMAPWLDRAAGAVFLLLGAKLIS